MAKTQQCLIAFALFSTHGRGATMVRKHQMSGQFAASGNVEISDDFVTSASKQSSSLVRDARDTKEKKRMEIDANGNAESSDQLVDATRKVQASIVRAAKERKSVEVDADGNAKMSNRFVDSMHQMQSLVRDVKRQKTMEGNIETAAGEKDEAMLKKEEGNIASLAFKSASECNPQDYDAQHGHGVALLKRDSSKATSGSACAENEAYPEGNTGRWMGKKTSVGECQTACSGANYTKFTYWTDCPNKPVCGCRCSYDNAIAILSSKASISGPLTCCTACLPSLGGTCTSCEGVMKNTAGSGSYTSSSNGAYVALDFSYGRYGYYCGFNADQISGVCVEPDQTDKTIKLGITPDVADDSFFSAGNGVYVELTSDGRIKRGNTGTVEDSYAAGDKICVYVQRACCGSHTILHIVKNNAYVKKHAGRYGAKDHAFSKVYLDEGASATISSDVQDCLQ